MLHTGNSSNVHRNNKLTPGRIKADARDVDKLADLMVGDYLSNQLFDGISKENYLKALISVHALTGCDTVSAFCGKEKWKAIQLLQKKKEYLHVMA